jgi:NAD(P)-dependent dehydrogenase (short-subunit alcohol dehydrogenase family)
MMNLPMTVDLTGKVAAVSGGGGILCSEMAKALAACGAKVAVMDRDLAAAQNVVDGIVSDGGEALAVACDVTDKAILTQARDTIESTLGPVHLLINGAGGNHPKGTAAKEMVSDSELRDSIEGSFFEMDSEGLDFVFRLNYQGTVLTTQVFAETMAKRGTGSVINVSSMTAYHPLTKVMAYSNAKAAVNSFTEWLAIHLAPAGIRVNAIAPGFFLTQQNYALLMGDNDTPTPRCQKILDNTPMNRLGKPEELLGATLYLASDDASGFVTGTVMAIDGGFNAYSGV